MWNKVHVHSRFIHVFKEHVLSLFSSCACVFVRAKNKNLKLAAEYGVQIN